MLLRVNTVRSNCDKLKFETGEKANNLCCARKIVHKSVAVHASCIISKLPLEERAAVLQLQRVFSCLTSGDRTRKAPPIREMNLESMLSRCKTHVPLGAPFRRNPTEASASGCAAVTGECYLRVRLLMGQLEALQNELEHSHPHTCKLDYRTRWSCASVSIASLIHCVKCNGQIWP